MCNSSLNLCFLGATLLHKIGAIPVLKSFTSNLPFNIFFKQIRTNTTEKISRRMDKKSPFILLRKGAFHCSDELIWNPDTKTNLSFLLWC